VATDAGQLPEVPKRFADNVLENAFYRVTFDPATGGIASIMDKVMRLIGAAARDRGEKGIGRGRSGIGPDRGHAEARRFDPDHSSDAGGRSGDTDDRGDRIGENLGGI
jgi:hypothetical protein